MKKVILALICALGLGAFANAQTVGEGTLQIDKKTSMPAFTLQINVSKKNVQETIDAKFKAQKLSGKGGKGGTTEYANVTYLDIFSNTTNGNKCNISTKVDDKGGVTTLYLVVDRGLGNYVTSSTDAANAELAKQFLTNIVKDIYKTELTHQIEDQTKVVEKAEKTLKSAEDNKAKLEKQLETAKDDINKANADLAAQKQKLDELKAKVY
ncbi:MAG: hypothetical protein IJ894_04605 [Bacteroidales bacterium]|jgi:hypothetical protein|nr:hypothetical protein [Bacteroidales bacterium]MBR2200017.1 hypothetical protein [Bacteroidales bacterium]MBR3712148.1 hypothetical protein [Bacteroidales bacterium]MBR4273213.1 hypothetical protein [Bacteroidales bacterium]